MQSFGRTWVSGATPRLSKRRAGRLRSAVASAVRADAPSPGRNSPVFGRRPHQRRKPGEQGARFGQRQLPGCCKSAAHKSPLNSSGATASRHASRTEQASALSDGPPGLCSESNPTSLHSHGTTGMPSCTTECFAAGSQTLSAHAPRLAAGDSKRGALGRVPCLGRNTPIRFSAAAYTRAASAAVRVGLCGHPSVTAAAQRWNAHQPERPLRARHIRVHVLSRLQDGQDCSGRTPVRSHARSPQ